jgi:hypothetical protein
MTLALTRAKKILRVESAASMKAARSGRDGEDARAAPRAQEKKLMEVKCVTTL